jgi:dTDP-4-amino-4,6-dideoxygalactose transaminase
MDMNVPFVDLRTQYRAIADEVRPKLETVMANADFILGHDVTSFEEEFATYCSVSYGIGLDSGTSALELSLRACEVGEGDEVITAANTFFATAAAITYVGARPILVDINPLTYNIDVSRLKEALSERTRAIIPVHLCGQPADMDPIMELAERKGLWVIEDACQAHGARYKGRRTGSIGHVACFSFYPAKNLGGYGDGGMVVTNDEKIAERVRMLRDYGQQEKYRHLIVGYNRRLDTLQATVLRVKLHHLDEWNEARRRHAHLYDRLLKDTRVTPPFNPEHSEHVYHLYVVQSERRDELREWLGAKDVATGIHYPVPVHLQPAYAYLGYGEGDFPVTEAYARRTLSLPMFPELIKEQIEYVVEAIHQFN